jgi:hypothetical protein
MKLPDYYPQDYEKVRDSLRDWHQFEIEQQMKDTAEEWGDQLANLPAERAEERTAAVEARADVIFTEMMARALAAQRVANQLEVGVEDVAFLLP